MKKLILIFIVITFLISCAVKHQTASGKPEVLIDLNDVEEVKGVLIDEMVNFGYTLQADNGMVIIFEKPMGGLGVIYQWVPPIHRAVFNIILARKPIRIVATLLYVKNPHSAHENATPNWHDKESLTLQDAMNRTKLLCEGE